MIGLSEFTPKEVIIEYRPTRTLVCMNVRGQSKFIHQWIVPKTKSILQIINSLVSEHEAHKELVLRYYLFISVIIIIIMNILL